MSPSSDSCDLHVRHYLHETLKHGWPHHPTGLTDTPVGPPSVPGNAHMVSRQPPPREASRSEGSRSQRALSDLPCKWDSSAGRPQSRAHELLPPTRGRGTHLLHLVYPHPRSGHAQASQKCKHNVLLAVSHLLRDRRNQRSLCQQKGDTLFLTRKVKFQPP